MANSDLIESVLDSETASDLLSTLLLLDWISTKDSPRKEYYCSLEEDPKPYTYGRGRGIRTYYPNPFIPESLKKSWNTLTLGNDLPMCFMNYYTNGLDFLGWHSDNSELLDDSKPIIIYTLGAEREIWFSPVDNKADVEKLLLTHNSICVMPAGYQLTHEHRIPKSDKGILCGPRVSLTFRGTYGPLN